MLKHFRIIMCLVFVLSVANLEGMFQYKTAYASSGGGSSSSEDEDAGLKLEYFKLNPLVLPIINDSGLTQQISIVISLEMAEGHKAEEIKIYEPRLADAYIQDLYGILATGYGLINGRILNVHMVKERLFAVTEHVLGPEIVNDVLLQVIQQRRL